MSGASAPAERSHALGPWLYLRALGAIHVIAFVDFGRQLPGLIGSEGLLPFRARLAAHADAGHGFWEWPTLGWWGASDGELILLAAVGAAAGLALLVGRAQRSALVVAYVAYLSLQKAGGAFMAYQWDLLLLEATVVALALAPSRREPRVGAGRGPTPVPRWALLAHGFLFGRLMFASGVVKLTSGDPDWASLGARDLHYWTQPLPNPLSLFAAALPHGFHAVEVVLVFVLELAFPWLLLVRGWPRRIGALGLLGLQVAIALTGNFGFFNLLAGAMALPLLDDGCFRWLRATPRPERENQGFARAVAVVSLAFGLVPLWGTLFGYSGLPQPVLEAHVAANRFGLGVAYGLFADMTDDRVELVFEGRRGDEWYAYVLPHQPGPTDRLPGQVAPGMPRLDWSLWFAALGSPAHEEVARQLARALREARPEVLALVADDPFRGSVPEEVRVRRYRYRPRDPRIALDTGEWWSRTALGEPSAP